MNITLRQLRAFTTVARLGSFTKAASALHATQPALSVQIGQLESALGLRLLDRTTRSVALTRVGRELLPRAERTLGELSGMVDAARGLGTGQAGRVVVAALPSVASSLLPEAIAAFAKEAPRIEVALLDAVGGRIVELVRGDLADLGIGAPAPAEAGLDFTPLGADRLLAVARRRHPIARLPRVTIESLVDYPLILMSRDSSVRRLVDGALAERGRLSQPVQEPVYMSTAIAMVRAGLGVAVLPSSAAEVRAATDLERCVIAHAGMRRTIGLLVKSGRSLSPAAASFGRFLQSLSGAWFSGKARKRASRRLSAS